MELQAQVESGNLGEVLMLARRRRGLTQEELGKDSGIGQAAVAKLERNRTVPKVTTLCRYLRALALTPEEELDVWHKIRGNVKEIDWRERLEVTDFEHARDRARSKLNGGDIYDAYGYIEAMHQLARDDDERAWAQMLHANRFKDLGLHSLAEQYYNRATVTLGTHGNPRTMTRLLLNLADLHVEQGRYTLADAYVVYALQRELDRSSQAYAFLVKGRILASRPGGEGEARRWFEQAEEAYAELKTPQVRDVGRAWARLGKAEVMARSVDPSEARSGVREMRALASTWGPSDRPENPELYTRIALALAERAGDDMAMKNAARLARRHGFRRVLERVKALGGTVAMMLLVLAPLALSGSAQARDDDEAGQGSASHGEKARRSADRPSPDGDHRHRSSTVPPSAEEDWMVTLWQYLMDPLSYGAAMKGEGEDAFSDNGPEE